MVGCEDLLLTVPVALSCSRAEDMIAIRSGLVNQKI